MIRNVLPMGNSGVRLNNKFLRVQTVNQKAILLTALMLLVSATPFVTTSSANEVQDIEVLDTVINPANNHTYHLLSASSWSDAASVARSLGGFLVTIDDANEDQWIFDTFAVNNDTTRHLWIGLSDHQSEEITAGMMELHSLTETGVMDNQVVETTRIMFTLQERTWEA